MFDIDVEEILSNRTGRYPFFVTPYEFDDHHLDIKLQMGATILEKKSLMWHLLKEKLNKLESIVEKQDSAEIKEVNQKGYSEDSFTRYLGTWDGFIVRKGTKIRYNAPDTSLVEYSEFEPKPDSRNYFYPDILLIHYETGLVFNIEIDEPYSMTDGSPVHFVCKDEEINEDYESYQYTRKEEFRNIVMKAKGIIVVRFAEEQVVKYPKDCIYLINCFIWRVLSYDGKKPIDFEACFTEWEEEKYVNRWSESEAMEMSSNKYRDNYLVKVSEVTTTSKVNMSVTDATTANNLDAFLKKFALNR